MTRNSRAAVCLLFITFTFSFAAKAQAEPADSLEHRDEVLAIVNFYRYLLNTVGGSNTSTRDKEVIINESYKKAFMSSNVQVEDDLLSDRRTITNKDITAYLRDVDFFFKDINFTFSDIKITKEQINGDQFFYLVSFNSEIEAITLEGDIYTTRTPRFIEINLDEDKADLKIASVYTTKVSREEELRTWWMSLSYGWTKIFGNYIPLDDDVSNADLLEIASIDSINLVGNQTITDLSPLEALRDLQFLDISDSKISDLNPLRLASDLRVLKLANSNVTDLSALQYFKQIEVLDASRTRVNDISSLSALSKLKDINLAGTSVTTFYSLNNLTNLRKLSLSYTSFSQTEILSPLTALVDLDLSRTGISNLEGLDKLTQLTHLDISETYVADLGVLSNTVALKELSMNQTKINSLKPLNNLRSLTKINADYSGVTESMASDFMSAHAGVVVVTNSEKVMNWWSSLPSEWQTVFKRVMKLSTEPTKIDIIKLLNRDSLDVSGLRLLEGKPLAKFKKLQFLDVSQNLFTSLNFTTEMKTLKTFIGTKLPLETPRALANNKDLEIIVLEGSLINEIKSLESLNKLKALEISDTPISEDQVYAFLKVNPNTVVIYRTDELMEWWENLNPLWKEALVINELNPFTIHELSQRPSVKIINSTISSLAPLSIFVDLQEIEMENTGVNSLSELTIHENMTKIVCKNGPLMDLEGVERHRNLQTLDVSNTAVDNLKPLRNCHELTSLNFAGTGIKNLKGLEDLKKLRSLNISNTRVWQLDRLYDIRTLNSLICYNTRVRENKLAEFKYQYPNCEVTFY